VLLLLLVGGGDLLYFNGELRVLDRRSRRSGRGLERLLGRGLGDGILYCLK